MSLLNFILSHFFIRNKPTSRWRSKKTGRFIKAPKFYRYTWGTKRIPFHGNYLSFAYFYWGFEEPVDGEEKLLEHMERVLGYGYDEWWFSHAVGFGKQEWNYDESLEGLEEYEP